VGEPTVEINAHGGVIVTNKILNLILENGARLAERGEFTRRAFLNGKISLEKAEAINQLIHAKTNIQTKIAINQFDSKSNEIIENLEQELLKIISICEINIDYSEYNDIETIDKKKLFTFMNNLLNKINVVIANSLKAIDVYKGVDIAIIGEPNVGKSSLFNLLIDKDKAIVTNIAGTTRDVLEDSFEINGILFNIIDTAGLRATKNVVESIGIDRSYKAIEKAKIIIHLFDLKTIKNKLDPKLQKLLANKRCINVLNKIDEISDLNSIRKYKDYV
jgi:tRNA modification GTPase trmE